MKKGSITVFLSLVLTLLFSFLLTTLEAARVRGATAYAAMITELAGESFLASYYYPLFQNYRLYGVNAGDGESFLAEDALIEKIRTDATCGMEEQSGGLLRFQNTEVELLNYQTLLSEGEKELLSQIRKQAALDGTTLLLNELFKAEDFSEAGTVGKVYQRQEEALEATATVTKEIIRLMELVDGIQMNSNGIAFDRNGKLQAMEYFVKQIAPMEQREIKSAYGNEEVFRAVSDKFYRVDRAADRVLDYLEQMVKLNRKIEEAEIIISEAQSHLATLEQQQAAEQEQRALKNYKEQKKALLEVAEKEYINLEQTVRSVQRKLKEALNVAENLKKKQQTAKVTVVAYESFLEGVKTQVSEEVYEVFGNELERMKVYVGLEENGFSATTIRQSLFGNYSLLTDFSLDGFSEERLEEVTEEMIVIVERMKEYTVEGLWFSYGDIVVAEDTWENVLGALGKLLTTGILSLVGVSKEEVSGSSLNGKDLPSAGLAGETLFEELMNCIEEVTGLLQEGGMGAVLSAAGNAVLDSTALELYSMKYFHSYGEESPYTKLRYEREYLVFGAEKDKSNLLTMVLHLIAIRTLFCLVMILKQPDRLSQLDTLAAGVVGFTGMPALAAVVKYGVMLLWSVEEALIEVNALLRGKRIAVLGSGTVAFGELFLINKTVIEQKAANVPEGIGAAYSDYLTLFSLTKQTRDKVYRVMDLIQENIRYRYNDSFRIRNVVTQLAFCVKTEITPLFDTGVFPEKVYILECHEERAY